MSRAKQLDPAAQTSRPARRRGPHILSPILFLVAIGFAAVAIYLYWDEIQNKPNDPTPPPAAAGEYTLAQVKTAFDNQGLDTEFGRDTADTDQLPGMRGQPIKVNGNDVYIFIFSSNQGAEAAIAAAEQAYAGTDEATIQLRHRSGGEIGPDEPKHVFQGSNIVAVMVGGDDEEVAKVQAALEELP